MILATRPVGQGLRPIHGRMPGYGYIPAPPQFKHNLLLHMSHFLFRFVERQPQSAFIAPRIFFGHSITP